MLGEFIFTHIFLIDYTPFDPNVPMFSLGSTFCVVLLLVVPWWANREISLSLSHVLLFFFKKKVLK